jgi:predicted amidohydrolase
MKLVLVNPAFKAYDDPANVKAGEELIERKRNVVSSDDVLLLPEGFMFDEDPESYRTAVSKIARLVGCTVIGGSHHELVAGKRMNKGCIIDPKGNEIGEYSKLRPYFAEQENIIPGNTIGEFQINGKNFLILICADFWYSDLILSAAKLPDVILVPSLSVSRKPTPEYSRSLWKNLAISRAYEFGAFVGISDWSKDSTLPKYRTCGVGGFADPSVVEPDGIFTPIAGEGISFFHLDFERLEKFREDRRMRGFFWKK